MKKNQSKTTVKAEDNSMILPLEMRLRSLGDGEKYLASFNANIGGEFAVRGIRLQEGRNGPYLSFPSYKGRDGYVDICFPVSTDLRQRMTEQAVTTYQQALAQHHDKEHRQDQQSEGRQHTEEPQQEESPEEVTDMDEGPSMGMQMG